MSDKVVDAKVIKKTQDTLGRIIKKPPLTEKLLQKPPFRFLHDVITSVIKTTGFMKGLFTETEMNSDNVKDKEGKIAFLQKLIDMVSLVIGKPVAAKPSKIVAGHDADRTNELLQALAEAINKKVDNDDYVRRVLKSDDSKPAAKKEKPKEEPRRSKGRSADADGDKDQSHSNEKSRDSDDKPREPDDDNKKEHKQERDRHSRRDGSRDQKRDEAKRDEENDERNKRRDPSRDQSRGRRDKDGDNQDGGDSNEQKLQRPTSAKGSRRHQSRENDESKKDNKMNNTSSQDDEAKQTSTKSRPMRPSSARPAPPKPKKNNAVTEDPVVPGRKVPNVIVDRKDVDSDDDDNEKGFGADEIDDSVPVTETSKPTEVDAEGDADHGGLVKKILETKKELENQPGKKTQIDRSQVLSDATRRKERDNAQHEIDRLRGSVQTLTRSVNPLGKILDFLQEDLDAMQKEMNIWRQENNENTIALQREQSVTDSSVEPLKAQLTELDSQIRDQLDLIAAVKSTILHNDLRVSKMLGAVTKS